MDKRLQTKDRVRVFSLQNECMKHPTTSVEIDGYIMLIITLLTLSVLELFVCALNEDFFAQFSTIKHVKCDYDKSVYFSVSYLSIKFIKLSSLARFC